MRVENIVISVARRHAKNISRGTKTVELRRRRLRIGIGTRVWIYTKLPIGTIETLAVVEAIDHDSPSKLWTRYRNQCGVSRTEFDKYFGRAKIGCAIVFRQVLKLRRCISLSELRKVNASFQPPQFFRRLASCSPELLMLMQNL